MSRLDDVLAFLPGSRADRERVVIGEATVELDPEPGVVCSGALPGLDGYGLAITPGRQLGDDGLGYPSFDSLGVTHNDRELTRVLVADDVRDELVCLYRVRRVLALVGERVMVIGDPLEAAEQAAVALAVARLCARPHHIAARIERMYRRFGGIASSKRWNTVDYHVALAGIPVRVDWPRLPVRGLVTRLHVDTAPHDDGFRVVDVTRLPPPTGVTVPLAISGARYVCVAPTAAAVSSACARLDRVLGHVGAALPSEIVVTGNGVDVVFAGLEEQVAAVEPAIALVRMLAGPSHTPGPYR